MEFILYILSDEIVIGILIFLLIYLCVHFLIKKRRMRDKENTNKDNNEEREDLKINEELKENIHIMDDFTDEDDLKNTNKFLGSKINQEYVDKGFISEDSTSALSEEERNGEILKLGLKGSNIVDFIHRVDEDGRIILPFDALDFFSRKHAPLILHDGSIRVVNLLDIEDEILLSIKEGKKLFIYDKKESIVKKIESEDIQKITMLSEQKELIDTLSLKEKEIENNNKINNDLLFELEKKEEEFLEIMQREKTLIEAYEVILKSKKTEAVKIVDKKIQVAEEEILEVKKIHTEMLKKDNSNIVRPLPKKKRGKEKIIEINKEDESKEILKDKNSEVLEMEEVVTIKEDEEEKVVEIIESKMDFPVVLEKKKLTKKDLKRISELLFSSSFLFSEDVLDNSKGKPLEQVFICSEIQENQTLLYLNKIAFKNIISKILIELYGEFDKSIEEVTDWFSFEQVTNKYFAINKNPNKLYKTIILLVSVDSDSLYGLKVGKTFTSLFDEDELIQEIEINEGTMKEFYESLLGLLVNGVYEQPKQR